MFVDFLHAVPRFQNVNSPPLLIPIQAVLFACKWPTKIVNFCARQFRIRSSWTPLIAQTQFNWISRWENKTTRCIKTCLHVTCASTFASASTSTLTLHQWLTQRMGLGPILCVCVFVTINWMLKLRLIQTQALTHTSRVNRALIINRVLKLAHHVKSLDAQKVKNSMRKSVQKYCFNFTPRKLGYFLFIAAALWSGVLLYIAFVLRSDGIENPVFVVSYCTRLGLVYTYRQRHRF